MKERFRDQSPLFFRGSRELLTQFGRVWISVACGVRQMLLKSAHKSKYSIHLVSTMIYRDLRLSYQWPCMKSEIAWFVERCLTFQKVKAEHQRPYDKMQLLPIPIWRWEEITVDFITKLPRTTREVDSIQVIVDSWQRFILRRQLFDTGFQFQWFQTVMFISVPNSGRDFMRIWVLSYSLASYINLIWTDIVRRLFRIFRIFSGRVCQILTGVGIPNFHQLGSLTTIVTTPISIDIILRYFKGESVSGLGLLGRGRTLGFGEY